MRSAVDPSSGFWRSLALYHFAVFASLSFRNLRAISLLLAIHYQINHLLPVTQCHSSNIQRLWNIAEQDVNNYADRVAQFMHNSSHHTKAEFNKCFVINSRYFQVLNKLTSSQTFFKTLANFSAQFQDINTSFFLQILLKKQITSIEQYALRILAFLPFRFSQKSSYFVFGWP